MATGDPPPASSQTCSLECTLGDNGARYKTPELEGGLVMQMLVMHREDNHQQLRSAQGATSAPVTNRNMRKRQKKPSADMEMTEAKWRDFLNKWA